MANPFSTQLEINANKERNQQTLNQIQNNTIAQVGSAVDNTAKVIANGISATTQGQISLDTPGLTAQINQDAQKIIDDPTIPEEDKTKAYNEMVERNINNFLSNKGNVYKNIFNGQYKNGLIGECQSNWETGITTHLNTKRNKQFSDLYSSAVKGEISSEQAEQIVNNLEFQMAEYENGEMVIVTKKYDENMYDLFMPENFDENDAVMAEFKKTCLDPIYAGKILEVGEAKAAEWMKENYQTISDDYYGNSIIEQVESYISNHTDSDAYQTCANEFYTYSDTVNPLTGKTITNYQDINTKLANKINEVQKKRTQDAYSLYKNTVLVAINGDADLGVNARFGSPNYAMTTQDFYRLFPNDNEAMAFLRDLSLYDENGAVAGTLISMLEANDQNEKDNKYTLTGDYKELIDNPTGAMRVFIAGENTVLPSDIVLGQSEAKKNAEIEEGNTILSEYVSEQNALTDFMYNIAGSDNVYQAEYESKISDDMTESEKLVEKNKIIYRESIALSAKFNSGKELGGDSSSASYSTEVYANLQQNLATQKKADEARAEGDIEKADNLEKSVELSKSLTQDRKDLYDFNNGHAGDGNKYEQILAERTEGQELSEDEIAGIRDEITAEAELDFFDRKKEITNLGGDSSRIDAEVSGYETVQQSKWAREKQKTDEEKFVDNIEENAKVQEEAQNQIQNTVDFTKAFLNDIGLIESNASINIGTQEGQTGSWARDMVARYGLEFCVSVAENYGYENAGTYENHDEEAGEIIGAYEGMCLQMYDIATFLVNKGLYASEEQAIEAFTERGIAAARDWCEENYNATTDAMNENFNIQAIDVGQKVYNNGKDTKPSLTIPKYADVVKGADEEQAFARSYNPLTGDYELVSAGTKAPKYEGAYWATFFDTLIETGDLDRAKQAVYAKHWLTDDEKQTVANMDWKNIETAFSSDAQLASDISTYAGDFKNNIVIRNLFYVDAMKAIRDAGKNKKTPTEAVKNLYDSYVEKQTSISLDKLWKGKEFEIGNKNFNDNWNSAVKESVAQHSNGQNAQDGTKSILEKAVFSEDSKFRGDWNLLMVPEKGGTDLYGAKNIKDATLLAIKVVTGSDYPGLSVDMEPKAFIAALEAEVNSGRINKSTMGWIKDITGEIIACQEEVLRLGGEHSVIGGAVDAKDVIYNSDKIMTNCGLEVEVKDDKIFANLDDGSQLEITGFSNTNAYDGVIQPLINKDLMNATVPNTLGFDRYSASWISDTMPYAQIGNLDNENLSISNISKFLVSEATAITDASDYMQVKNAQNHISRVTNGTVDITSASDKVYAVKKYVADLIVENIDYTNIDAARDDINRMIKNGGYTGDVPIIVVSFKAGRPVLSTEWVKQNEAEPYSFRYDF